MNKKNEIKKARRPYIKPQLEQVQLTIKEAVLQACKTPAAQGPHGIGTYCQNPGGHWCSSSGS